MMYEIVVPLFSLLCVFVALYDEVAGEVPAWQVAAFCSPVLPIAWAIVHYTW